jgi:hypothetical protein
MRIKALILVGMIAALPAFGQGRITFLNTATGTGITGGSPVTDVGGAVRLTGATFWAQLYAAPGANQAVGSLQAVGSPVNFRTGAGAGFVPAGLVVTVPSGAPGTTATIQMRAWEGAAGSTYEAALAGGAKTGFSNIVNVGPLGGPDPTGGPDFLDPFMLGVTGFSLVPEPSTIALGLIGAAALLLRRRKQ